MIIPRPVTALERCPSERVRLERLFGAARLTPSGSPWRAINFACGEVVLAAAPLVLRFAP
ncbi:MAG: hypothetical protein QOD56_2914, partial [Gammaproteobacteria bacterium]|nr:hypothetical protein [Gammaproteobacteria bacterium]